MKKFIGCLTLCFCVLLSGIIFAACDSGADRKISFEMDSSLLSAKVIADKEEVEANENGVYIVGDEANVRLELYATQPAIDISSISIKENGTNRTLQKNENYAPLQNADSCYCGYFLIPRIDKDVEISITDVEKYRSTFSFSAENVEDGSVKEMLNSTKIGFDENLLPLNDVLATSKTYVRDYDASIGVENTHHVLRMQLEDFEMYDFEKKSPFRVRFDDGRELAIYSYTKIEDVIYVDLGNIGYEKHYTIVADFKDLAYKQFSFSFPEDVLAYSIETSSKTIDVSKEGLLYLTKTLDTINYGQVEVKLDGLKLEKVEEDDQKITFKIPKNIVPENKTDFKVSISGIEYLANTFKVTSQFTDENESGALAHLTSSTYVVDENGSKLGVVDYDQERNQIVLENMTVALAWQFVNYVEAEGYVPFDFDLLVNDAKIFNIKEILSVATEEFTNLADFRYEFDENIILRAKFNQEKNCFDNFQFEIKCNSNLNFSLNFK